MSKTCSRSPISTPSSSLVSLASRAADTYVLASTEKLGAVSPYTVLPLRDVTAIVTDARPDAPVVAEIAAAGTRIIAAEA
jgi:DeoR/GlpR family transcriptional regulator of sugar metabolism